MWNNSSIVFFFYATEPLDIIFKTKNIAYLIHQIFMAHIVRIWRKKQLNFIQTQTEQKYEFGADADTYMMKLCC